MSLLHREARPLGRDRDDGYFRDKRLFLIACDDRYAPAQYFEFLRVPRIQIIVDPTLDGKSAPRHVLQRLRTRRDRMGLEEDDECWLVLDTDHHVEPSHRGNFLEVIQEAKAEGIRVALSRPCFEFWLLLHHADETEVAGLANCDAIQSVMRAKVGSYNKTKLVREHYMDGLATEAVRRAERLDVQVAGGDVPEAPTTRVYQLIRAILSKGLPSQVPSMLR
jgi:hypothetical protein